MTQPREEKLLHVVHVALSLDVGGLERNILNQVRQASAVRQRVTVVCLQNAGELAPQVRSAGAQVISLDKPEGFRPGYIPRLRKVFEQIHPDVVHTHQLGTLFYGGPAAWWAGVRLIVHTEHGREPYATRWRTRLMGRFGGHFVSTFFCLTQDMASLVRDHRIVAPQKIQIIFNGIDTSQFLQRCDTLPIRRSMGIPENAPVVGTAGRLAEIKRQDVLLRAFAAALKRFPEAHLVLLGDGPLRKELQDLAASLEITPSVHFPGYQSPTTPYIQAMNIFALTSRSEGMPQAAIEASVCGLPVVASRVGGLPELIDEGNTGRLFPVGDDAALAEILCQWLADPELAQRLGQAARQRAIDRFDIARMAREYHQHFEQRLGLVPAPDASQAANLSPGKASSQDSAASMVA